jgi:mRNA interferase MazF
VTGRAEIYWADLGPAFGSRPAKRRPVLVVQSDEYNATPLASVIVATVTSNVHSAAMPGNVFLPAALTGLPHDSVVNVTSIASIDEDELLDYVGTVPSGLMQDVDRGLRRVLDL